MLGHSSIKYIYNQILTEDKKFEAVVVTVAAADDEEYLKALAKKVHMAALHRNTRPAQPRRRMRWTYNQQTQDRV